MCHSNGPRATVWILTIFSLFWLSAAIAPAAETFTLYWENDSRFHKPNGKTDRHYTNGLRFVYVTDEADWKWLKDFGEWDLGDGGADHTSAGFFLGHEMYTPDHAGNPELRSEEDMQFAGWAYGGLFAERYAGDILDHAEINIGFIGPSAKAASIQSCVHGLTRGSEPVGWETQLKDEPALDLSWFRKHRVNKGWLRAREDLDFIVEYGATLGSVHRQAQLGVMGRYGILPGDFGPGRMRLPAGTYGKGKPLARALYFFARGAIRAVEYNRFLSGLDRRPLVGEAQYGMVYRFRSFEFGYSQTFFTQEFEEQTGNDSIGAFTVAWSF